MTDNSNEDSLHSANDATSITFEDITIFANNVYQKKYQDATPALVDILEKVILDRFHQPDSGEGSERTMTFLASAITTLFSDPAFALNETGFRTLISLKMALRRIFVVTPFRDMTHIFGSLGEAKQGQVNIAPENLTKLMLIMSIDCLEDPFFQILENIQEDVQILIWISLLDTRYLLTDREQTNLGRLIAMIDKIKPSSLRNPLEIQSACRVWFYCSYWDHPRKHDVKSLINQVLKLTALEEGYIHHKREISPVAAKGRPTLLLALENWSVNSAMFRCYSKPFGSLKRDFNVVAIVKRDSLIAGSEIFDEIVFFDEVRDMKKNVRLIENIDPDIFFYPSIGMDSTTVQLAQLRLAPIQIMAAGHPASSFSSEIDYLILPEDIVPLNLDSVSEKMIAHKKELAVVFQRPEIQAPVHEADLKTDNKEVVLVCNSMYQKISPAFLDVCKQIQEEAKVLVRFNFLTGTDGFSDRAVRTSIEKKLKDVSIFRKLPYQDYLSIIAGSDLQLTPFPFGNTNSFIDAMLVGVPTICLDGSEIASRVDGMVSKMMELPEFCRAKSINEYIKSGLRLVENHSERGEISKNILTSDLDKVLFSFRSDSPQSYSNIIKYIAKNHHVIKASDQKVWYLDEQLS